MDKKIELIPEEGTEKWHWVILKYDNDLKRWYNIGCGIAPSYLEAAIAAKDCL